MFGCSAEGLGAASASFVGGFLAASVLSAEVHLKDPLLSHVCRPLRSPGVEAVTKSRAARAGARRSGRICSALSSSPHLLTSAGTGGQGAIWYFPRWGREL